MTNAYQSIETMGGLETEADYPYKGMFYKTCHMNDSLPRYVSIVSNDHRRLFTQIDDHFFGLINLQKMCHQQSGH